MINQMDRNIIWAAVHNVVDGYPVFPDFLRKKLDLIDSHWEYLPKKLIDYTTLTKIEEQFLAACIYSCTLFMDENDAGAVMDCTLQDIKNTYEKVIKEWSVNEDDYKKDIDNIKNNSNNE